MKKQILERVLEQINENLEPVRSRQSSDSEALALIYIRIGDFLHAEQFLSELREARPENEYTKYNDLLKIAQLEYLLGKKAEAIAGFSHIERNIQEVGEIYHDMLLVQLYATQAKLMGLESVRTGIERLQPFLRISVITTAAESALIDGNRDNVKGLVNYAETFLHALTEEERNKSRVHLDRLQAGASTDQLIDSEDVLADVRLDWRAGDKTSARVELASYEEKLTARQLPAEQIPQLVATAYLLGESALFARCRDAYEATLPAFFASIMVIKGILHSLVVWGEEEQAAAYIDGLDGDDNKMAARIMLARELAYALPPRDESICTGLNGTLAYTRLIEESERTEIVLRDLNSFREMIVPGGADEGYESALIDEDDYWTLLDVLTGESKLLALMHYYLSVIDLETGKVMPFSDLDDARIAVSDARYSPDGSKLAIIGIPLAENDEDVVDGDSAIYVYSIDSGKINQLVEPGHEPSNLSWSPDGSRLLCVSGEKSLISIDLKSNIENVYEEPDRSAFYLSSAVFCDDGKAVVLTKTSADMDMTSYMARLSSEGEVQVLYGQVMMQCSGLIKAGNDQTLLLSRVYSDQYHTTRPDILLYQQDSAAEVPIGSKGCQVSNPVYMAQSLDELNIE